MLTIIKRFIRQMQPRATVRVRCSGLTMKGT
jgi:hypothetical protein